MAIKFEIAEEGVPSFEYDGTTLSFKRLSILDHQKWILKNTSLCNEDYNSEGKVEYDSLSNEKKIEVLELRSRFLNDCFLKSENLLDENDKEIDVHSLSIDDRLRLFETLLLNESFEEWFDRYKDGTEKKSTELVDSKT